MGLLNREKLLKKQILKMEKVDLGDGEFVFVKQMTGRERDRFEQSLVRPVRDVVGKIIEYEKDMEDFRAKLAVHVICDEQGNTILGPRDYEDLSKNIGIARLELIVGKAQELNKISEGDKEALIKN